MAKHKEEKTNVMRVLDQKKIPYTAHTYDPENGIDPGTAFEDLPDDWVCPVCGEGKWAFEPLEAN